MADTTVIRKAQIPDIEFIIDTIIESQKSGTNKISYCNIYSLKEVELKDALNKMG